MRKNRLINIFWLLFENFGLILLSGVSFLAFAFYLSPAQLGLGTIAIVVSEMVGSFYNAVFESPMIKRNCESKREMSSIFWLGGLLSALTMALVALLYYLFNSENELWQMLLFATISVAVSVQARPFIALMRCKRQFKKLALRTLWGKIIGAIVAIGFAFGGAGGWTLIIQLTVMNLVALVILLFSSKGAVGKEVSFSCFFEIFKEGFTIGLRKLLSGFFGRGLILILSIVATPALIGYYSFGRRLVELPKQAISAALRSYSLPVFASRINNKALISRLFSELSVCVFLVLFPAFVFMGILGKDVIVLIFGDKWVGAVNFFFLFSIISGFQILEVFTQPIQAAFAKSHIGIVADVVKTIATLSLAYILVQEYGLLGIALIILLDIIISVYIRYYAMTKLITLNFPKLLAENLKIIVITFTCASLSHYFMNDNETVFRSFVVGFSAIICQVLLYYLAFGNWVKRLIKVVLDKH